MTAFLLIGLGNPGKEYAGNRHNVGFMALDAIAAQHGFSGWGKKFRGQIAEGSIAGRKTFLLKPQTYMNLSGESAGEMAGFYKIPLENIIVIHDELDLLPGVVKIKFGGGSAGHNGLKDISLRLGQPDYWRLRLGIGHPRSLKLAQEVGDFVLHRPALEQFKLIEAAMQALVPPMKEFLVGQRESAIARIHRGINLLKEDA